MAARVSLSYRCAVVARALAAGVGGYALAASLAYALARVLPTSRSEAVFGATLIAMLAMPLAAIWAFAVRQTWLAIAGIVGLASLAGAIGWLAGPPA